MQGTVRARACAPEYVRHFRTTRGAHAARASARVGTRGGRPETTIVRRGWATRNTDYERCIVVLDRQTTPCLIECGGAHATRASHEASAVRLLLGGRAVVLVVDQAEGLLHVLDELARLLRERAGAGATARVGVGVGGSRGVERRREARPEGFGRFGCDARAHLELGSCPPGTSPNPNPNPKP